MMPRRGFTLLELLLVLVVVGIMAAMAAPLYAEQGRKVRRSQARFALLELLAQQERHRQQHHSYAAFSAASSGPWRWWLGDLPATSSHELDAQACPGMAIAACVVVRARPGTARVDTSFADPECGTLTLDSMGRQGADGPRCWP